MAKAKNDTDPVVLAAFDAMVATIEGVSRKGAAIPYLSTNGNMYASISRANVIGLRLNKADRDEFLATYDEGLFESMPGFLQKEYVAVPAILLGEPAELAQWFARCHANACNLKPKPTKKPLNKPTA